MDSASHTMALDEPSTTARRQRPSLLVWTLGLFTFGFYGIWWLGATWAEMKREIGDPKMSPFWHALTIFVPIYGLYRFHAHFRTIGNLVQSTGGSSAVHANWVVFLLILSNILTRADTIFAYQQPQTAGVLALVTFPIGLLLLASIFAYGQHYLNRYMQRSSDHHIPIRVHWGEWVALVVAILIGGVMLIFAFIGLTVQALGFDVGYGGR